MASGFCMIRPFSDTAFLVSESWCGFRISRSGSWISRRGFRISCSSFRSMAGFWIMDGFWFRRSGSRVTNSVVLVTDFFQRPSAPHESRHIFLTLSMAPQPQKPRNHKVVEVAALPSSWLSRNNHSAAWSHRLKSWKARLISNCPVFQFHVVRPSRAQSGHSRFNTLQSCSIRWSASARR